MTARARFRIVPLLAWSLCAVPIVGASSSCATNPATGDRQLSLIGTGQEVEMGRNADQSVVQTMGVYENQALQEYVAEMGQRMAAISERPDLPWTFRVVDEPMVNAFAIPGGFVYMTRGILAHFGSEAQLAAVMGHEIGHVTARHSVNQMSRAQLANLGLGLGSVLSSDVARFQGLISAGLQLAFLSFSRDDERESDMLGLRYMTEVGYDPREMPGVFRMLSRASGGEAGGVPEWLSTHPNPENREERIEDMIREMPIDPSGMTVDREEYLRLIDGIVFGDDPRAGYFVESAFLHPELRFRFDFPAGWQTVNQRTQVVGQPEGGGAIFGLTLSEASGAEAGLREFLGQEGMESSGARTTTINGNPAARSLFRAPTEQGVLAGTVAFIEHGDQVYSLLGYTTESELSRYRGTFDTTIESFRDLDDPALLDVEPRQLEIVELPRSMTFSEFVDRYPSTIPPERVAVINQVGEDERLESGRLMKRVVGEGPPESF